MIMYVIQRDFGSGPFIGSTLLISWMPIIQEMEHTFTRNFLWEAQGQTFEQIGKYLPTYFSHGQLYVELSRVQKKSNVILAEKNGTSMTIINCVHKEILI